MRHFSYSDRIRYYWASPAAEQAVERLFDHLRGTGISAPLVSQFLPTLYPRVASGELPWHPKGLVIEATRDVLRQYDVACGAIRAGGQAGRDDKAVDMPAADDRYDLGRFVEAQESGATYKQALDEIRRGRKTSHWMWFIFPQVAGLGQSPTSRYYAISSLAEAKEYLRHPVLGPRLLECSRVVAATEHKTAVEIFGGIDAQKLRSCMTLFMRAAPMQLVFSQVLDRYFRARPIPPRTGSSVDKGQRPPWPATPLADLDRQEDKSGAACGSSPRWLNASI